MINDTEASVPDDPSAIWPPRFPHAEIDELIRRLRTADAETIAAERLLQLVAREAERLRRAVVKLSVNRLSAAEREAHEIMSQAQTQADDVRSRALTALDHRLDEAEELARAMRRSFLVEHRLSGNTSYTPRDPFAPQSTGEEGPER